MTGGPRRSGTWARLGPPVAGMTHSEIEEARDGSECHFKWSDSLLVSSYGPGELSYTLREPPAGLPDASGPILSLLQKIHYLGRVWPIKKKRVYIHRVKTPKTMILTFS